MTILTKEQLYDLRMNRGEEYESRIIAGEEFDIPDPPTDIALLDFQQLKFMHWDEYLDRMLHGEKFNITDLPRFDDWREKAETPAAPVTLKPVAEDCEEHHYPRDHLDSFYVDRMIQSHLKLDWMSYDQWYAFEISHGRDPDTRTEESDKKLLLSYGIDLDKL